MLKVQDIYVGQGKHSLIFHQSCKEANVCLCILWLPKNLGFVVNHALLRRSLKYLDRDHSISC